MSHKYICPFFTKAKVCFGSSPSDPDIPQNPPTGSLRPVPFGGADDHRPHADASQKKDQEFQGVIFSGRTDYDGATLAFGPGLSFASSTPGAHSPVMISDHRDTHCRFLQNLTKGERLILKTKT